MPIPDLESEAVKEDRICLPRSSHFGGASRAWPRRFPWFKAVLFSIPGLILLLSCGSGSLSGGPTSPARSEGKPAIADSNPAPIPTTLIARPTPSPLSPTPTPLPDSGWLTVAPGLEGRLVRLYDADDHQVESLYHLRLDPDLFTFQVAYHPGRPHTLAEWQAETGDLIVLNGGFFTPEYLATGLTVVAGQVYGKSFEGFGGMLVFDADGMQILSLREQPYDLSSPPLYALQSFPILIEGGRSVYANEDQSAARRTAIALDRQGRLLIILASWGHFSLAEFSRYLGQSDLDIDVALNLDGGASTGLLLAQPEDGIPAYSPLPVVITVSRR